MKRIAVLIPICFFINLAVIQAQQTQSEFIESSSKVIPWNIEPGKNWPEQSWAGENWPEEKTSKEDLPEEGKIEPPKHQYNVNININKQPDKPAYRRRNFFLHKNHQSRKSSKKEASQRPRVPTRKHRRVPKNIKQSERKHLKSVFSRHFGE